MKKFFPLFAVIIVLVLAVCSSLYSLPIIQRFLLSFHAQFFMRIFFGKYSKNICKML